MHTLALLLALSAAPVSLHPENPHYLQFRGEPTFLITAGEHYGAVLAPILTSFPISTP